MRLDHHAHPRLLRKTALGEEPVGKDQSRAKPVRKNGQVETTSPRKGGRVTSTRENTAAQGQTGLESGPPPGRSRFMGATHLDDARKQRICTALETRHVGDEIGRQIFIGALEYQLSSFGDRLQRHDDPAPNPQPRRNLALEKTLTSIEHEARLLSRLLQELPEPGKARLTRTLATQDELARGYDERYLCELGGEIHRLEQACATIVAAGASPEEPATEDPTTSRELVVKLADIFAECFETEPTAEGDGQFRATLTALDEITGFIINHEPDFLARVLASRRKV